MPVLATSPVNSGSSTLAAEAVVRRRVKAELRKRLRGLRSTTPIEACARRSALIVEKLAAHPAMARATGVALYWPMIERHEVDLRALDASLRARGVRVAYPALSESGDMQFRWVANVATLEERGHLFLEPGEGVPVVDAATLDVLVVPAIGADPSGHRIGYGAGYYDRALGALAGPRPVTIAVAYDFALLAEVPVTDGDVAADWVVTDARVLERGGT